MPSAHGYRCPLHDLPRTELHGLVPARIGATCNMRAEAALKLVEFVSRECCGRVLAPAVRILDHGHRGHANTVAGSMSLPLWILHHPNHAFQVYYIAHEVAHLWAGAYPRMHGEGSHGPFFKRTERRFLKRFGMGIRYQRAYPRTLFALKDGRELYVSRQEESHRAEGRSA